MVGKTNPETDPQCQVCELSTPAPGAPKPFPANKCIRCLRGFGVGPTGKVSTRSARGRRSHAAAAELLCGAHGQR